MMFEEATDTRTVASLLAFLVSDESAAITPKRMSSTVEQPGRHQKLRDFGCQAVAL